MQESMFYPVKRRSKFLEPIIYSIGVAVILFVIFIFLIGILGNIISLAGYLFIKKWYFVLPILLILYVIYRKFIKKKR